MKTQILPFAVLLIVSTICFGQTEISGIVKDVKNEPIVGANVYLEGSFDGTSSDSKGHFSFQTDLTDQQVLIISFIGYEENKEIIDLNKITVPIIVTLRESINKIDGVVITAGSFEAGGEHKREVMKSLDIVTTAGASADIAGALNTLPGTQTVGEEGRLFVRGGTGEEAKTFIDGLLALEPYHTTAPQTPTRNRFSPFLFSGTSFSTGGYSAEYGQALSSALILKTKDQDAQNRTDLSLLNLGVEAGHSYSSESTTIVGKIGYFNMQPYFDLVPQNMDWTKAPESIEANLAVRKKVGKTGQIKFFSNYLKGNSQHIQYSIDSPDQGVPLSIENDYLYLNSSYRGGVGDRWSSFMGAAFTNNQNTFLLGSNPINERHSGVHAKATLAGPIGRQVELVSGLEYFQRAYSYLGEFDGFQFDLPFSEPLASAFIETDVYITNSLLARAGGRLEKSWMNNQWYLSPRASIAYKTGEKSQISFAYGKFSQAANNRILRINSDLDYERAEHFILNYQIMLEKRTFRIEAYHKNYDELVKYDGTGFDPSLYSNNGYGYAQGIDLFWRDNATLKNVDYWISYSYINTERDFTDFPQKAVPTYVSNHNFSIVYKHFIPAIRTQISSTYSFASPRPFNDANGTTFNGGRTPQYHDLGLSFSHLLRPNLIIHGSMTNLLARDHVFGYDFGTVPNQEGLFQSRPISTPARHFFILGIFFTISPEGTLNQMKSL